MRKSVIALAVFTAAFVAACGSSKSDTLGTRGQIPAPIQAPVKDPKTQAPVKTPETKTPVQTPVKDHKQDPVQSPVQNPVKDPKTQEPIKTQAPVKTPPTKQQN